MTITNRYSYLMCIYNRKKKIYKRKKNLTCLVRQNKNRRFFFWFFSF